MGAYRRIYNIGPMRAFFREMQGWVIDGEPLSPREIVQKYPSYGEIDERAHTSRV